MSWYSLAFKNIKKSFADYVVYFLTLIFGVAIFYVFNSIKDQSAVKSLSQSSYESVQLLLALIDGVSIVVSFVLGFLIVHANNFLIRRRKKEFGIYLMLGMGKKEVSRILIAETFFVGMISLVAGIVIGVFAAQFMSILVAKFFEADMSAYVFSVSVGAIGKTIFHFAIIYVVVLLFHSVAISKFKLIDLFTAEKKAEKQVLKNPILATILFLAAAAMLSMVYYKVGFCYKELYRSDFITYIVLGIAATFLLFWSLSGFLWNVLRRMKGIYYKNLNAFVIRQFCNSINSSAVSMAITCLMLFAVICAFCGGFSLTHKLQENIRKLTPADFSILYMEQESVSDCLRREGILLSEQARDLVEIKWYQKEGLTWESGMGDVYEIAKVQFPHAKWETKENVIALSDYNRLAKLYQKETYELAEDEYLIVCDFYPFMQLRNMALEQGECLSIGEVQLKPAFTQCVEGYMVMSGGSTNTGVLVVPDEVLHKAKEQLVWSATLLAGNYRMEQKEEKKQFENQLTEVLKKYTTYDSADELPIMTIGTKRNVRETNNGTTMVIAFLIIYIGVVFLLASAALLALKALSESIDAVGKYAVLRKIGSEKRMLSKALFLQIGVYFGLPMLFAMLHSVFGLRFINFAISSYTQEGVTYGIIVTTILLAILYGGYLFATFQSSKKIVEIDE